jgi:hypothetical protein
LIARRRDLAGKHASLSITGTGTGTATLFKDSPQESAMTDPKDKKTPPEPPKIRPAGPDDMKDKPRRKWEDVDQASDESFPASDPPPINPGVD